MAEGSAICVVEHNENEERDSYLLKEDRLQRLLLQAHCRDKPVAVVSIAGGARRGKSFLLSLFLRYLRAQGSENWLEDEDTPITGFAWKMSSKRVTTGIHIWDEIFTLRLANGEEACVLLMDTEGTFDCEESLAHSVTVFALSTLLSSVQIYNLKDNIHMDDLLHLQVYFTGYGRLCLETSDDKPFQNFLFLVRDWRNHHEVPYGSEGGQEFLDEKLKTSGRQREDVKKVKEDIKFCFTKLNCFLMPYPGERVAGDPHFSGSLSDIQEDFKDQLRLLVQQLLSPENLALKTIAGSPITCKQLFEFFKCYIGIYNNRAEIPEPKSIFEATAEVQHRNACDEAVNHYTKRMDRLLAETPVPTRRRLNQVHASLRVEAIEKFTSSKKMGGKEVSGRFLLLLDKSLHEKYEKYEIQRDAREEQIRSKLLEAAARSLKEYGEDMAEVLGTVPLVTKEELRVEHQEKKAWAIQYFLQNKEIAGEDLFTQCKEKLEKDIESQSAFFFTDRQWKETTANGDLINAIQSTVWIYCSQMGHSCGGAVITEEELESEHRKHYKEAINAFLERTQNTLCPYLLDGHHQNLMRRLDEQYMKYIELRESRERQAETELINAKESAMEIYNDQMSKLLVDLMSEEKLNNIHGSYQRQTMISFEETGKKYPHLAKKHTDDLELRMSSEYKRYKAFRNSQEHQAESALQDAVERSVALYELEMSYHCGGKDDEGRQGATDNHLLTKEELLEGHEKYRREVLQIFWAIGAQWPHLADRYKEELEERLTMAKDHLERKRKNKEKRVGKLLVKSLRARAEDYLSATRMKKFYGETVVTEEELKENHEEHRDAVVRSFVEDGDWAPAWLFQEYRDILVTTLDDWHRSLETKMTEERAKRYQAGSIVGIAAAAAPLMAGAVLGPIGALGASAAIGALGGTYKYYNDAWRWQNEVVPPDPSSIPMSVSGLVVNLSSDEDNAEVESEEHESE
ncbi:unnamed protein product [Darwinula stevensoni]|uniref:GB1/RHD3-type G domain-containing protein n=1 Tax=Darwinula stevensoni TaxID=69355 RepID=A0A7R9ADA0_9CRUS|nr:unnamed protein product [Darwinula stevensoni]CAG0900903.1 unnamed protein product [Darwinula stevensoni]